MHPRPEIAILSSNVLTGIGLKTVLEKVVPAATVELFTEFDAFAEAAPERFFHYFVSTQCFLSHAAFFRRERHKTILLTDGRTRAAYADMHALDTSTSEECLLRDILRMQRGAHPDRLTMPSTPAALPLTDREREVLSRVAQGSTSRQIAAELNISLTTVLTHRRNLMDKLRVRSVAELLLHAIAAGYVDAERF